MNFYKKTDEIVFLLNEANEKLAVKQLEKGISLSLMPGEGLSIICTILKTYSAGYPELFELIKHPASEILNYARDLGRQPSANFDFLESLSRD